MKIKCWGVRGSVPTPSTPDFDTRRYGGNTTCYQIISGGLTVCLDAGTGVRVFGNMMARKSRSVQYHFFFSHMHWDHIQGLPFFSPAYHRKNDVIFHGPRFDTSGLMVGSIVEEVLRRQQACPVFPVSLEMMASKMDFVDLIAGRRVVIEDDAVKLTVCGEPLNHPGGCFGYRFEEERKDGSGTSVCAICTDHEHGSDVSVSVQKLAAGAQTLIYDAAYTQEEYLGVNEESHRDFGHSTWQWGLKEAIAAGCKRLYLTHHAPWHDDAFIHDSIEQPAQRAAQRAGITAACARENLVIGV